MHFRLAAWLTAIALTIAGCGTHPIAAGAPHVVDRLVIAPYALQEECAQLAPGDRLDYRYESTEPLEFELHYREGDTVLAPLVRERSKEDSGTFEARVGREYCLMWVAGPPGAIIGYRVLVRHGAR